ncbi:MAG TPA: hypothetical protein VMU22_11570 [Rhizomicrobium sp.]|nr:hypothetical protein [Rhizomicrobium sp.]
MKAFAVAVLGLVAATAASAQSIPGCKGSFEVIRMDSIKPGKMDAFKKAVADHQAWYRAHGANDRIILGRIVTPGAAPAYAEDQAMTIHVETPNAKEPEHDAGWTAFVAEYKDSSTITSQTMACLEDAGK